MMPYSIILHKWLSNARNDWMTNESVEGEEGYDEKQKVLVFIWFP